MDESDMERTSDGDMDGIPLRGMTIGKLLYRRGSLHKAGGAGTVRRVDVFCGEAVYDFKKGRMKPE